MTTPDIIDRITIATPAKFIDDGENYTPAAAVRAYVEELGCDPEAEDADTAIPPLALVEVEGTTVLNDDGTVDFRRSHWGYAVCARGGEPVGYIVTGEGNVIYPDEVWDNYDDSEEHEELRELANRVEDAMESARQDAAAL